MSAVLEQQPSVVSFVSQSLVANAVASVASVANALESIVAAEVTDSKSSSLPSQSSSAETKREPKEQQTKEGGRGKGAGKGKGKRIEKDARPISQSTRAGLRFPVGRIGRYLHKGHFANRISAAAPVYLSAALEYLAVELLELSGNACKDAGRRRVMPRDIQLAVKGDSE